MVSYRLGFLVLALLAALPPSALALTASQVYEQVKDSVVVVKAYDQKGKLAGLGSGVMLPSGDVITNYHVLKAGVRYTVGRGKQAAPATVKAGDPDKDLCLLHAPGLGATGPHGGFFSDTPPPHLTAKPARLGRAARLKVGEPVYAVGAPQGLELSLSEGIVSQLRGGPPPIIQTTVAISPGSSGGGLFNAEGELVGITTFYLKDAQSLNFALPVEWIGEVAAKPKKLIPYTGEVIPLKPTWSDRADALEESKNWAGLLAWCRRWTQAEPDNEYAWFSLAIACGKLGRHREAIAAYRECLRLEPDIAVTWYNLGHTYGHLRRYREANGAYQEVLRLEPDNTAAWYMLGLTYAILGNRSAALEAVKELRRYDPKEADRLFNLIMKP
jgi:hypothetical protein